MSIKVYGFWRSIASFRIRVALKLKALPFEEISIDILQGEQFKPGYDEVNPEHVVPTFIHDGHTLYQSLAIMEYLDDIKPSARLLPDDIKERAYARSLALMTIADVHPLTVPRVRKHLATTFGADAHAIEAWGAHWSTEGLAAYERFLARRKPAPFALGKDVGMGIRWSRSCRIGSSNCPNFRAHTRSNSLTTRRRARSIKPTLWPQRWCAPSL
jgi:maleylacetoacetate isomerase